MTLVASTVWEVRTTGNDVNGGGWVPGAGTDKTQSDTPAYSATDLVSTNATSANPTVTSASRSFDGTDVNNIMNISAGTSWTPGPYQIISASGGIATLDKACGSVASVSGGTYAVGGALATPGKAGSFHVAGNIIWLRSGLYLVNSVTSNVAGGCLTLINGTVSNTTKLIGYGTTRGDAPNTSSRPLIQATGAISSFTLVNLNTTCYIERVQCDGNNLTLSKAFGANGTIFRCKGLNCKAGAFSGGSTILCEATGCSSVQAFQGGYSFGSAAYNNTAAGFTAGNCFFCIAVNCTNGFATSSSNVDWVNCIAYGNTTGGFNISASANHNTGTNCLSVGNTGIGFVASSAADNVQLNNCAGYGNSGGNISNIPNNIGFINLTGNPFNNPAGNDFSLNGVAGAGAACRAAGILGLFPGLATTSYQDLGAVQHQDPGGGLFPIINIPIIRGRA